MFLKKISFLVVCVTVALCVGLTVKAEEIKEQDSTYTMQGYFEYPITPEDSEWVKLGSTQARLDACRIPQDILASMTEEQLIQAVLDFPFLCDVFFIQIVGME